MGIPCERYCSLWRLALLAWFVGGIGGISIDIDHILSAATQGSIPWTFLHVPTTAFILAGCVVTSLGGLVISLVLTENKDMTENLIERLSRHRWSLIVLILLVAVVFAAMMYLAGQVEG